MGANIVENITEDVANNVPVTIQGPLLILSYFEKNPNTKQKIAKQTKAMLIGVNCNIDDVGILF